MRLTDQLFLNSGVYSLQGTIYRGGGELARSLFFIYYQVCNVGPVNTNDDE